MPRTRRTDAYQCSISSCKKYFWSRTHLDRHMLIHDGVKPFKCSCCRRAFRQRTHLQTHIDTQHAHIKRHVCGYNGCTEVFGDSSARTRHRVLMHGHGAVKTRRSRRHAATIGIPTTEKYANLGAHVVATFIPSSAFATTSLASYAQNEASYLEQNNPVTPRLQLYPPQQESLHPVSFANGEQAGMTAWFGGPSLSMPQQSVAFDQSTSFTYSSVELLNPPSKLAMSLNVPAVNGAVNDFDRSESQLYWPQYRVAPSTTSPTEVSYPADFEGLLQPLYQPQQHRLNADVASSLSLRGSFHLPLDSKSPCNDEVEGRRLQLCLLQPPSSPLSPPSISAADRSPPQTFSRSYVYQQQFRPPNHSPFTSVSSLIDQVACPSNYGHIQKEMNMAQSLISYGVSPSSVSSSWSYYPPSGTAGSSVCSHMQAQIENDQNNHMDFVGRQEYMPRSWFPPQ